MKERNNIPYRTKSARPKGMYCGMPFGYTLSDEVRPKDRYLIGKVIAVIPTIFKKG